MADEGGSVTYFTQDGEGNYTEAQIPAFDVKTALPEDLREHDNFKDLSDVDGLSKTIAELYNGKSELETKVQELTPIVPEKPEDYNFETPEGMEALPEDYISSVRNYAHEKKISIKAAQAIFNRDMEVLQAGLKQQKENQEKAVTALKESWGDKYDKNIKLRDKAFETFAAKLDTAQVKEFLNAEITYAGKTIGKVGDHPVFSQLFHGVGSAIDTDKFASGGAGGSEPKQEGMKYKWAD